jgi:GNAT superfamily N-acetyltransferase
MAVVIRPRTEADLPGVAALLVATHHSDAYPVILLSDMEAWGAGTGVLEAWVAVDPSGDGQVVGHVALADAEADDDATRQWLDATGLPIERLGVVRRLVVHEQAHGHGLGEALLATAVDTAHARGLRPVLDMADNLAAAGRLYERAGFERIGAYDLDLTEFLRPGDDGFERDGQITHHLHVLTWIGPEPSD